MTGGGVNDAPALKRDDIGVAIALRGTDVAREASSLVLLDDDFATIVAALREGRRIFDNIRKFVRFAMTGNSSEVWTILLAPFLGLPIPLLRALHRSFGGCVWAWRWRSSCSAAGPRLTLQDAKRDPAHTGRTTAPAQLRKPATRGSQSASCGNSSTSTSPINCRSTNGMMPR